MPQPLSTTHFLKVSTGAASPARRVVAEETPVALVYNGTTYAVMMATPDDLEDFAIGFSLCEGVIASISEIDEIAIVAQADGIELRIWLAHPAAHRLVIRRRAMLGPTACGLCGIESLAAVTRELPRIAGGPIIRRQDIVAAMASAVSAQALNRAARSLHAAGFWVPGLGLVALREDVGRHNALDKLTGSVVRAGVDPGSGIVVLTSRVSVEMVQKAAALGVPIVAAMSAPTALALRMADAAGITLIASVRQETFDVFTHPWRLIDVEPMAWARPQESERPAGSPVEVPAA